MEESDQRLSGARVAGAIALAVVAIVCFVLLADVRLSYDDPVFDGITQETTRKGWTVLLLAYEAIALVGILLLLLVRRRGSGTWSPQEWTSAEAVEGGGRRVQIGCPGCGTVFEKPLTEVDEPHEQDFRCPNCGRAGRLRLGLHKSVQVRDAACANCGRDFRSYRQGAECPHCHAPQP